MRRNENARLEPSVFAMTAAGDGGSIAPLARASQLPQVLNHRSLRMRFGPAAVDRLSMELHTKSIEWPIHVFAQMLLLREQAELLERESCDRSQELTRAAGIQ